MEKLFADLGFTQRETKVYLALLDLGETKMGPLAAKTRLQSSKIYQTLEKLIDKGLVTFVLKSKIKYFQAQDPLEILNILKEKEQAFTEVLAELQQRKKFPQERQVAKVYEGYKGIKSLYNSLIDSVDSKSYYYVFAFRAEYDISALASRFLRDIHFRLNEKKVDDRIIGHGSVKQKIIKNYGDIKRIKLRFTSHMFPQGLVIVNDRVINLRWGERPTAVEIISSQIAQQYKAFFLEMWKQAKP